MEGRLWPIETFVSSGSYLGATSTSAWKLKRPNVWGENACILSIVFSRFWHRHQHMNQTTKSSSSFINLHPMQLAMSIIRTASSLHVGTRCCTTVIRHKMSDFDAEATSASNSSPRLRATCGAALGQRSGAALARSGARAECVVATRSGPGRSTRLSPGKQMALQRSLVPCASFTTLLRLAGGSGDRIAIKGSPNNLGRRSPAGSAGTALEHKSRHRAE